MKTFNNLFDQIITFENLLSAVNKAAKGKRENPSVILFFYKLEENLLKLIMELTNQTYIPGKYTTFRIYDPKPRMISAAPFRDRVVHHALLNIIGPLLERSFVFDSYANRIGKGTHKAIRRYQYFSNKYDYVLKCDIKKYFPSIDHEVLKSLVERKITCNETFWLIKTIIDHSNFQDEQIDYFPGDNFFTPYERRKGLPIGNLTSQFLANFYLNPLDHFVKETLRCKGYIRYVDDFVLFAKSKSLLWYWENLIELFIQDYRLLLNPKVIAVYPVKSGRKFLGQIVFPNYRLLPSANVRKFKKRLKNWSVYPPENLSQRIAGWSGHAKQANSYNLLRSLQLC